LGAAPKGRKKAAPGASRGHVPKAEQGVAKVAYTDLLYHLVFSTKNRTPCISEEIAPRLLPYLGGIVRELGGNPLAIGGASDHVHLLVALPPAVSLSAAVRTIKANSSRWARQAWPTVAFGWQAGYAAFTVSHQERGTVLRYVREQEQHHRRRTFGEELARLLEAHEVEYDARHLRR
jgi:putative transposase